MGVICPNETKCLCKYIYGGEAINTRIYAEFEEKFFQKGTLRYCYKGTIKNLNGDEVTTNDFYTGKCVVKVYQNNRFTQDYYIDFICSLYAYAEPDYLMK